MGLLRTSEGTISVNSQPGQGATFKVLLQVAEEEPAFPKDETSVAIHVSGWGQIFVVDDESMVRNMAESMLRRKLGYDVIAACDGFEGLEIFSARKEEITLVIFDPSMPGMNGWETLSALRARRPDIPVIISSGYDEAYVVRESTMERPWVFLYKPYAKGDLMVAVDTALKKS